MIAPYDPIRQRSHGVLFRAGADRYSQLFPVESSGWEAIRATAQFAGVMLLCVVAVASAAAAGFLMIGAW